MIRPKLTPHIAALPDMIPFVGPETLIRQRGRPFAARLGANESGFGPSPKVITALKGDVAGLWQYADPENFDLRTALAAHIGGRPENISVDRGIDGLLEMACRQYVQAGSIVVTSLGGYPTFNYHVAAMGGVLRTVPYRNDHEDLDGLAAAVRDSGAPLVYLANPDNPMGTWHSAEAVSAFIEAIPETTMIILDEAYGETAPDGTLLPVGFSRPNLMRMRTFSKAYGLAGMRLGYVFGEAGMIAPFNRIRNQFGMSRLATAGGLAALADQNWLTHVVAQISASRDRLSAIARANGFAPIASAANFVSMDCGRDGVFAKAVLDGLIARGIFVRKPMAQGLDRCIRVSCGPEAEMALFEAALPGAIKDAA